MPLSTQNRSRVFTWLALGVVFLLFVIAGFMLSFEKKAAIPARLAMSQATTSAQVRVLLGEPVRFSGFIRGRLIEDKGNGTADLEIDLRGSSRKGRLAEWAQEEAGKWHICGLTLDTEGRPRAVVLVDEALTHCERE